MADAKARVRDPEGTRAAILEAATRIFASRGFVGASMRDISDASGIREKAQPIELAALGPDDE
jgi:TetR/AcrR family transcriptional regulator